MATEYDKRTGTCPYWTEIENPREHRAFILSNVVFSGEYDAFTLSGLKERLEPYDLGMTDDDLRRELGHYVENGQLEARIDGWAVRKTDICGRRSCQEMRGDPRRVG